MKSLQSRYQLGISAAVGLLLLLCTFAASAKALPLPENTIQSVADSLKTILHDNQERIKTDKAYVYQLANDIVAPRIDFNKLSGLALGKHWRRATPEQKKEFMHQFQRLLVRTYATAFNEFGEWSLRFIPRHDADDAENVLVRSEILRSGAPPVSVKYRMHKKGGEWFAYDVVIEGISLVTNYRTTFAKEVRRNGMQGLIERVTKLNNKRVAVQS
ncbi:phospholipid-binding protein MlaC [Pseudomonadota bacterium]